MTYDQAKTLLFEKLSILDVSCCVLSEDLLAEVKYAKLAKVRLSQLQDIYAK